MGAYVLAFVAHEFFDDAMASWIVAWRSIRTWRKVGILVPWVRVWRGEPDLAHLIALRPSKISALTWWPLDDNPSAMRALAAASREGYALF